MKRVTQFNLLLILLCNLIVFNNVLASEKKVFYAGFSFSGNYIDKSSSIQFTNQLINEKDENGIDIISKSLIKTIKKVKAKNFNIDLDDPSWSPLIACANTHANGNGKKEPISLPIGPTCDNSQSINVKSPVLLLALLFSTSVSF